MSVVSDKKFKIKQVKQQLIVDATVHLIINMGINNITMEDIASASDYSKKTLYSYFKSKDEILLWSYSDDLNQRWAYQKKQLLNGIRK